MLSHEKNLERKIKKHIYGKTQAAKMIYPAGFGSTALSEIEWILANLWFAPAYTGEYSFSKNEIRLENIHFFTLTELMLRTQSLTDIRLIIFEGKAVGKQAFEKKCLAIPWDLFLQEKMAIKIKVDSVASRAFHETGLKQIVSHILKKYGTETVSGEDTNETTCVYVELYKDRLTVSISLAGEPLYRRGYRNVLSASAPLREDAAFCCMQRALQFAQKIHAGFSAETIFIPFSGTGTFAFEYLQHHFECPSALFSREYALQYLPLFREKNFQFLLKKAQEHCLLNPNQANDKKNIHFFCVDHSKQANKALLENKQAIESHIMDKGLQLPAELFSIEELNFFELDIVDWFTQQHKEIKNLWIMLNPPYGIRLNRNADSIAFYKNIAHKINYFSRIIQEKKRNMLGFILCPDEATWSVFLKNLSGFKTETYHFTQGGIDIRVCQFFI